MESDCLNDLVSVTQRETPCPPPSSLLASPVPSLTCGNEELITPSP